MNNFLRLFFSLAILIFFSSCENSTCEQKVQKLEKEMKFLKTKGSDQIQGNNGKKREETIERFEDGSKKLVVTFIGSGSNEQIIKKVSYYSNGKTKEVENYNQTELNGSYIEYYRNGQVSVSCEYLNGQRHGEYVEYYFDGKLWETGRFHEGDYDGEYITYFTNGKIKSYEHYKKGDRTEAVWYKLNGEVEFKN